MSPNSGNTATNTTELESLVTKFTVDSGDFMTKTKAIMDRTEEVVAKFAAMSTAVAGAVNALNTATATTAQAMTGAVAALTQASQAVAAAATGANVQAINSFSNSLTGLSQSVAGLQAASGSVQQLMLSFRGLNNAGANINAVAVGLLDLREALAGWNIPRLTAIAGGIDAFGNSLRSFRSAGVNIGDASAAITSLRESLAGWNMTRLGAMSTALTDFGTAMASVGATAGNVGQLPAAITALRTSLTGWNMPNLGRITTGLTGFGTALGTVGASAGSFSQISATVSNLANVNLANFTTNMAGIGTGLSNMLGGLGAAGSTATNLSQLATSLGQLQGSLQMINARRLGTLAINMGGFANSLAAMGNTAVSIGQLQANLDSLVNSLTTASANFPKSAVQMARSLARLTSAVHDMSLLTPGAVLKNAQEITQAMNLIGTLNTANIANAVNILSRAGRAMRNLTGGAMMASGGGPGGGKGGGWFGGLFGGLGAIPPAANNAGMSLRSAAYDSMVLQRNAEGAGGALISLRYGLLGLGALGLFQFSQMDEALTRLSARTRDFGGTAREEMRAGLLFQSGRSINSVTEQGKALEKLMTAGLSATGAVKALAEADNFATAAGMKMGEATKGLTDLLHAMDEVGNTPEEFRANMTKVADLLVGVSSQTGATEKQMMEAFTSRFQTSSRLAKLTIEESVAVLGAFARAGDTYRGAKGGNIAARGIEQLLEQLESRGQWLAMFGDVAYDSAGKVKPLFEVLTMLQDKMGEIGTDKFIANLKLAGLGGNEKTFAIEPLLRTLGTAKDLRMEMAFMVGSAEKAADTIRKSLMSQVYNLGNSLGNAAAVIGERLAPALYLVTKPLTDMMNAFAELNPAIQNFIVYGSLVVVAWRPALWLLTSLVSVILSPATGLIGAIGSLAYGFGTLLYHALITVGSAIGTVYTAISNLGHFILFDMTKAVASLAVGFVSMLGSGLMSLATFAVGLAALPVIIGLIAAPIATLVIGITQLSVVVGDKLAGAWAYMKENASDGLMWIGDKISDITTSASSMWKALIQGSRVFFAEMSRGISLVSGLLWNFRENIGVILDFIDEHGAKAFEDLFWAASVAVEAIAINLGKLAYAVGVSLVAVFKAAWQNITDITMTFVLWFKGQWLNIGRDLSTIFTSIFGSLLNNFLVITETIFSILSQRAIDLVAWPGMTDKQRKKILEDRPIEEELKVQDALNSLAGPFQGLKLKDFKTDFGDLGEMLSGTFARSGNAWKIAGNEIAKAFSTAVVGMNPILAGFEMLQSSDMWKGLMASLNFTLPEVKDFGDFLRKSLNLGPTGEDQAGMAMGKGGPGFQFKQGSMERFIYDGGVNEKIQFQMLYTMQAIKKDTGLLASQRGIPAVNPTTVLNRPTLLPMPREEVGP